MVTNAYTHPVRANPDKREKLRSGLYAIHGENQSGTCNEWE